VCLHVLGGGRVLYASFTAKVFIILCCIRPLSSSATTQAARGTNIINSSRLSYGAADLIYVYIYNLSSYGGGDLTSEHRFSRCAIIISGVFVGNF